jgi:hypothetical protein
MNEDRAVVAPATGDAKLHVTRKGAGNVCGVDKIEVTVKERVTNDDGGRDRAQGEHNHKGSKLPCQ